jgi:endoglucanase
LNEELFRKLVTTPGISGREERIREVVKEELAGLVDEVKTDRLGNVIGIRKGKGPRVMLAAHMDSIGFLVRHVDDEGFVWLSPVGGFDPRTLAVQRVLVSGKKDYVGLVFWKTKPIHVLSEDERKKPLALEDMYVDLMRPAAEVKSNVTVGDPIVLYRDPIVSDYAVSCPYLDDRLGVYVLLEALKKATKTKAEIHAVISVQEEVGLRGARTGAYGAEPDLGIALDITIAADTPGTDPTQRVSELGKGAAIGVMDAASISDPRLVDAFRRLAEKHNITHQMEILPRGGTDAGAIQMSRGGVPVITISIPVRYVHTANEMAAVEDVHATVDLMARFLQTAQDVNLDW